MRGIATADYVEPLDFCIEEGLIARVPNEEIAEKTLEKLHDEVRALYFKGAMARLTKTSVAELERLAADMLSTAVLVYQETLKARQSEENRSWRTSEQNQSARELPYIEAQERGAAFLGLGGAADVARRR